MNYMIYYISNIYCVFYICNIMKYILLYFKYIFELCLNFYIRKTMKNSQETTYCTFIYKIIYTSMLHHF